jgi:hypothetical protein
VAGPWFTVTDDGDDWHVMDRVWFSDGKTSNVGHIEIQVRLMETTDAL